MAALISSAIFFFWSATHSLNTGSESVGRSYSMWRADYSQESPLLPKSPRCRWAACLISADYSLIGVLQNTMTSALFTDGINHSLVELEIPNGFILSSLFGGCVAQPVPLMALTLFFLLECWVANKFSLLRRANLCRDALPLLDCKVWSNTKLGVKKDNSVFLFSSCEGAVGWIRQLHIKEWVPRWSISSSATGFYCTICAVTHMFDMHWKFRLGKRQIRQKHVKYQVL